MRTPLILAVTLAMAGTAQAMHPSPLVEAEWLEEHLNAAGLVVLDVRSTIDDGGDRTAFEAARIPGSRYSNYAEDGWREERDGVAGLMPDVDDLARLIGGLGIDNGDTVIVVPAGTGPTDFASATRVYWTFKTLGHDEVAILNGGFAGWERQGFETASGPLEPPEATAFSATLREELHPRDFGSLGRYYLETRQKIKARYPLPGPLPLARLTDYMERHGERYDVELLAA